MFMSILILNIKTSAFYSIELVDEQFPAAALLKLTDLTARGLVEVITTSIIAIDKFILVPADTSAHVNMNEYQVNCLTLFVFN